MSVIFSSDFNTGNFADWSYAGPFGVLVTRGCSGTYCLTCGNNTFPFGGPAFIPTTPQAQGTIRWQMAIFANPATSLASQFINVGQSGVDQFQFYTLGNTGEFILSTAFTLNQATPPGTIPLDGTWHSYEFAFTIYPVINVPFTSHNAHMDATLAVDGVAVFTWTNIFVAPIDHTPTARPASYDKIHFAGDASVVGAQRIICGIDNVEIDDDAVILGLPACEGITFNANICVSPPATTVTGMGVDCDTNQITVVGTNFTQHTEIALQGPQGESVAHTVLSQSLTELVLQLTDPLNSGQHCVTVTNY